MNSVWRIWSNPTSLLAKVFKGKYFHNSSLWNAQSKSTASPTLKSMLKAKSLILRHLHWIIRNGMHLSFWEDKWCGNFSLRNLFIGPLGRGWNSWTVNDFLIPNTASWDFCKLRTILPLYLCDFVLSIPLSNANCEDEFDKPFWPYAKGICSVSSAYRTLSSASYKKSENWDWLWNLNCAPKLKFFIWRIIQNGLPTKANLKWVSCKRYSMCGQQDESIVHILRHCTFARIFWTQLHAYANTSAFMQGTMKEWLINNGTSNVWLFTPFHVSWANLFLQGIWSLWIHRNNFLFSPPALTVQELVKVTYSQSCSYCHLVLDKHVPRQRSSHITSSTQYLAKPPYGYVRVDVHSTFTYSAYSGIGVIIWDHDGRWLKGFSKKMIVTDSNMLDLWGIYHALVLLWNDGFRHVILHSSNEHTLALLNGPLHCALLAENLVLNCRKLMEQDWCLRVKAERRLGSQAAGMLSKHATNQLNSICTFVKPLQWLNTSCIFTTEVTHM